MIESKPLKVTIVSYLLGYGPVPKPGDEISQRITINNKGRVWFSAKTCDEFFPLKEVPLRKVHTRIDVDSANDILNRIGVYFQTSDVRCFATDVGVWETTLTLENGEVIRESGSMHCCSELNEISDIIRSVLPNLGVQAFGEDYNEDDDQL